MKKDQSREKSIKAILKAALTLFGKKGFSATTTDEIAAKAKVSKGLIYFYFSSKEEILKQLIEEAFQEVEENLPENLEPIEIIEQFLESFKRSIKDQEKWKLVISVLFQHSNKTSVVKILKEKYLVYTHLLSQQFLSLGSKNPQTEARKLLAILDGLALQSVFAADLIEAEKVIDFLFEQYKKKYPT